MEDIFVLNHNYDEEIKLGKPYTGYGKVSIRGNNPNFYKIERIIFNLDNDGNIFSDCKIKIENDEEDPKFFFNILPEKFSFYLSGLYASIVIFVLFNMIAAGKYVLDLFTQSPEVIIFDNNVNIIENKPLNDNKCKRAFTCHHFQSLSNKNNVVDSADEWMLSSLRAQGENQSRKCCANTLLLISENI